MTIGSRVKAPRLAEVAVEAGVARSTACQVLNGRAAELAISIATRDRVLAAAARLGYSANASARALRRRRTESIGLVQSDFARGAPWLFPMAGWRMELLEVACSMRGYSLQFLRYDAASADRVRAKIASRQVDGFILTSMEDPAMLELCERMQIPCVDVMGTLGLTPICAVEADVISARVKALVYARSLGHRRIGMAYKETRRNCQVFNEVLRRWTKSDSIDPTRVTRYFLEHDDSELEAPELMDDWLSTPAAERPTLLIGREGLLVRFIHELQSRGLRCPEAVSLIGLSHTSLSENVTPRLTSIDNKVAPACQLAVDLLIDAIEADRPLTAADSPPPLACELIHGGTCAPPPNT